MKINLRLMSAQPVSATIQRFPYANEAKLIIVGAIRHSVSEAQLSEFKKNWHVHRKPEGVYEVDRDFFALPKNDADQAIERALSERFKILFQQNGDKLVAKIVLIKIQAPSNQIFTGARAEACCFGGACRNCPQFHA